MKNLILIIILGSLFSCRKRCKEEDIKTHYNLLPTTITYYNSFKEGNWWVYESSSFKKDSVFLSNYSETKHSVSTLDDCYSYDAKDFRLNSLYYCQVYPSLKDKSFIDASISGSHLSSKFDIVISITHELGKDFPVCKEKYDFQIVNDSTFYDVVEFEDNFINFFLSKKEGIIQYIDKKNQDTFKLTKYYVK